MCPKVLLLNLERYAMANRNITKKEMLLAIAMSKYYMTSHVMYIAPATNYRKMLGKLKRTGDIEPFGDNFYRLTNKGWAFLRRQDIVSFEDIDKEIDKFVDNL